MVVDYSQIRAYLKCPLYWFERYVRGVVREWPERLRSDALALGALTHSGLESHYRSQQSFPPWVIDPETIDEVTPTPECLALANLLVSTYVREYAGTLPFRVELVEKPLVRPLLGGYRLGQPTPREPVELVAKIDTVFSVPETTSVPGGDEGECILTRGVWSLEHKTKGAKIDRGLFMRDWEVNLQASFQVLTMREHFENVQGVVVDVLEKPLIHVPKRKCPSCAGTFEFAAWKHVEDDQFACPHCGEVKAQKPYVPKQEPKVSCFRFAVKPTEKRLQEHLALAKHYGEEMRRWVELGCAGPNPTQCVTPFLNEQCEYFEAHANYVDVKSLTGFRVEPEPLNYIGLASKGNAS